LEKMRENLQVRQERAILVGATLKGKPELDPELKELEALAVTAGAIVVDKFRQKLVRYNPATYIGKGKAELLAGRLKRFDANVIIFDTDLAPNQIRDLEEIIGAKVIDRSELILDIFATRAKTLQAKLQVELAQLEYTYPRLTRMWGHLDTVVGGGGTTAAGAVGAIGTRGPGEKQLEIDRRLVQKRISVLKADLAEIDKRKLREIDGRRGIFKVCLVGYTNAGKSTLMNSLTNAGVFVEDRLFATLDTRTRKWKLGGGDEGLLSDTVGFVKNLPHHLVASFKATLEEAVNADLLLHVVDISSDDAVEQLTSVNKVLSEIGCGEKPTLMLLNKADVLSKRSMLDTLSTTYPDAICISAKTGIGLEDVVAAVVERLHGGEATLRIKHAHANGKIQSFLRSCGTILKETYSDSGVELEVRIGRSYLAELGKLKADSIEDITGKKTARRKLNVRKSQK
jgi:GTP-binding protein HflX